MLSIKMYKLLTYFCILCRGIKCYVFLRVFKVLNIKLELVLQFILFEFLSRLVKIQSYFFVYRVIFLFIRLYFGIDLVFKVGVFVFNQIEQVEGNRQEGGVQEVFDGGQVGDGYVVRIIFEFLYEVNYLVIDIQKDDNL